MTKPEALEVALRPNLTRSVKELGIGAGDELGVECSSIPLAIVAKVVFE